MVRLPGIRHPSSDVYSQVDFYPHHDVGQERCSYPGQYLQVPRPGTTRDYQAMGIAQPFRGHLGSTI
jgi:hypothetical protein